MRTSRQASLISEEDDFIELGKCKLVSDETYFADTNYVTASMLKTLATDTKLYEHRYVKGHQMKETPAMELGSAVHAMLAGMEDMVVAYDGVRRGKDYLAWVQDQPEGALIVPKKVHEIAFNCMLAMDRHPLIHNLLSDEGLCLDTRFEECFAWTDDAYDTPCKFKPDWFNESLRMIIDYKTIARFSERAIKKQIIDLKYHLQAAHYMVGASYALNQPVHHVTMIFMFVETAAPYRCAAIKLSDEDADASLSYRDKILEKLDSLSDAQDYRESFQKDINVIQLPRYSYE